MIRNQAPRLTTKHNLISNYMIQFEFFTVANVLWDMVKGHNYKHKIHMAIFFGLSSQMFTILGMGLDIKMMPVNF